MPVATAHHHLMLLLVSCPDQTLACAITGTPSAPTWPSLTHQASSWRYERLGQHMQAQDTASAMTSSMCHVWWRTRTSSTYPTTHVCCRPAMERQTARLMRYCRWSSSWLLHPTGTPAGGCCWR